MFPKCPKCHAALAPGDANARERCPACGLIFSKYVQAQRDGPARAAQRNGVGITPQPQPARLRLLQWLLHVPERCSDLAFYSRCGAFAFFFVWGWRLYAMDIATGEMNGSFMHLVILVFHEAGHVLFVPLGPFMTILGGSLLQVLLPLLLLCAFLFGLGGARRDNFAASLMLWWTAVAVIDLAPYIWDAFDPKLMLLDGRTGAESDGHDWQNILGDLGLIRRAHAIAAMAHRLGLLVLLLACSWGAALLYLQFRRRGGGDTTQS